jgi:hypothetical protein
MTVRWGHCRHSRFYLSNLRMIGDNIISWSPKCKLHAPRSILRQVPCSHRNILFAPVAAGARSPTCIWYCCYWDNISVIYLFSAHWNTYGQSMSRLMFIFLLEKVSPSTCSKFADMFTNRLKASRFTKFCSTLIVSAFSNKQLIQRGMV